MVDRTRRLLLRRSAAGALVAPLAGFLAACGGKSGWPEGMVEIKWDRDVCARCSMVISNRRFAAQIRGGPHNEAFKFDDVGCLAFWLRDKARELPWLAEAATRLWVADHGSKPEALAWLDARQAHYLGGKHSPMGYGYAAYSLPQAGSLDFDALREQVVLKGK
ncbi:MAG: nitrous oxide reductase accessory protein NosL [Azonexus sp.]|nr:nitrous oxide reductase accessory protein NosL [Betaproteobacteria bacterium]MBP6036225.1 nitrous oxide reductase accessory protein NosL [Azonexus sp.]MBP6906748.1 nitrous oxide reductase accessory protein NosL [Azonexus sp.]